jgi:hypothetical protein
MKRTNFTYWIFGFIAVLFIGAGFLHVSTHAQTHDDRSTAPLISGDAPLLW